MATACGVVLPKIYQSLLATTRAIHPHGVITNRRLLGDLLRENAHFSACSAAIIGVVRKGVAPPDDVFVGDQPRLVRPRFLRLKIHVFCCVLAMLLKSNLNQRCRYGSSAKSPRY